MTKIKDFGTNTIHSTENSRLVFKTDSIVDSIIDQFIDRAQFGKAKYNTDLDRNDLYIVDWLNHAQEEAMDFLLYMQKIKKELVKLGIK